MKRTIIEINEEKCVGCGLCASACEQGAIQMIDGKAKLVSDTYCDGLGMCLPACPVDAIKLTEKEANAFDSDRKGFALKSEGCGSTKSVELKPKKNAFTSPAGNPFELPTKQDNGLKTTDFKPNTAIKAPDTGISSSQLRQWPVQINLVNVQSEFFEDANILIAADCTAYAYARFHEEFIRGKVTLIGCPKLDYLEGYIEKLTEIFKSHHIQSVTVARMSVPCCGGLTKAVKEALERANKRVPYLEQTITPEGNVL
ncbi:MAG: 4Fe-4S binding protein [Clostridia bacterium]|nr:4Fe-4S binding protein [Clostridia bacterium]